MGQTIYGLSKDDVVVIKSLIKMAEDQGWRPPIDKDFVETYSPDVYVALVPVAGIPALTEGSPAAPGYATCSIYKIVEGTGTGTDDPAYVLEAVSGLTKTVFNLSTEDITSTYVPVMRTKFGFWVAVPAVETSETGTGSTGTSSTGTSSSTGTATATASSTAGTATSSSGTGTTGPCYDNLTESTSPSYILGIDADGCMVKVPVTTCP